MDKQLLSKVKAVLSTCTPENVDKIKTRLMVMLKPHESEEIYEYFLRIETEYISETCKAHVHQVIPKYGDYFTDNSSITEFLLDDY